MFTALVLICAGGIKDPELCFYQANQNYFPTYQECRANIKESVLTYPYLFEFYDEELQTTFKVTDWRCIDWKAIKA